MPLLPLSVEKVTFNLKVETFICICRDRSSSRLADAGACMCVYVGVCVCVDACVHAAWGSSVLGPNDRQTGIRLKVGYVHVCFWMYVCVYVLTVQQQVQ